MEALELECPGQATDIDNENRLQDMVGGGGRRGQNVWREANETYALPCVKRSPQFAVTRGTLIRAL